jgi:hypothetical protein
MNRVLRCEFENLLFLSVSLSLSIDEKKSLFTSIPHIFIPPLYACCDSFTIHFVQFPVLLRKAGCFSMRVSADVCVINKKREAEEKKKKFWVFLEKK